MLPHITIFLNYFDMKLPKHIVELFRERYGYYPSIVDTRQSLQVEVVDKLTSKGHLLWYCEYVDTNGKVTSNEKLIEYDSTGIFIYVMGNRVIFLTTINKKNIVDFTLHNLLKTK